LVSAPVRRRLLSSELCRCRQLHTSQCVAGEGNIVESSGRSTGLASPGDSSISAVCDSPTPDRRKAAGWLWKINSLDRLIEEQR
jgi:hypothetical protein